MTGRRMVNKGSSVEKIMHVKVIDREIVKRKKYIYFKVLLKEFILLIMVDISIEFFLLKNKSVNIIILQSK